MSEHNEFQMSAVEEPTGASGQEQIQTDSFQQKPAGFWTRFWAYLIDLIVIYAIAGLLIKPVFRVIDIPVSNPSFLFFTPYKITILIVLLLYFTLMTKYFQQTIGKMVLGIKVVPKTGAELSWGTLIFREVIGRFISKTLVLPYLLVPFMPKKEALHDIFADTYVVHEDMYEKKEPGQYLNNNRSEQLQEGPLV